MVVKENLHPKHEFHQKCRWQIYVNFASQKLDKFILKKKAHLQFPLI